MLQCLMICAAKISHLITQADVESFPFTDSENQKLMLDLRETALACLLIDDPWQKAEHTQALYHQVQQQKYAITSTHLIVPDLPGRPDKPELVSPRELPRRRNNRVTGHATLIHAICHIEFNAINLALDAIARFETLPELYYLDWLQVANEESQHFLLLDDHLKSLGYGYGYFPAHNGMWEMAAKTHHDPLIRMALVPRVLEARGLDVTPSMMKKLASSGDHKAVEILDIILKEEVGHVAIGTHWFNYLCKQRELDALSTFKTLLDTYFAGELRGPFHTEARLSAGFTEAEMEMLSSQATSRQPA